MNLLLVEDDGFKLQSIIYYLNENFGILKVDEARSIHEAITMLRSSLYDLVLLDMSLPSHRAQEGAGGVYSHPVGGLDILFHICTKNRSEKVIIITQYPHIEFDQKYILVEEFVTVANDNGLKNLINAIRFDTNGDWQQQLTTAIKDII